MSRVRTISVVPTCSLPFNNSTTANGTMSWIVPDFPLAVDHWDSIKISGKCAWDKAPTELLQAYNYSPITENTLYNSSFGLVGAGWTTAFYINNVAQSKTGSKENTVYTLDYDVTDLSASSVPLRATAQNKQAQGDLWQWAVTVTYTYTENTALFVQSNGKPSWAKQVYKKVNGHWQLVQDLTTIDSTTNWVKGNQ